MQIFRTGDYDSLRNLELDEVSANALCTMYFIIAKKCYDNSLADSQFILSPDTFKIIHERVSSFKRLHLSLAYVSAKIWEFCVKLQRIDTASEIYDVYKNVILEEFDVEQCLYEILEDPENLKVGTLDYLCTLTCGTKKMCELVETILYNLWEDMDYQLDIDDKGVIVHDGRRIESEWKPVVDWLVSAGWTPDWNHTEEERLRFKEQYFSTPLQRLMSFIDEHVQEHISEGTYVQLSQKVRDVYNYYTYE